MKVKLLVARASATGSQNRGEVVDVTSDEGGRMIDAGHAELVRSVKAENATKRIKAERAAK